MPLEHAQPHASPVLPGAGRRSRACRSVPAAPPPDRRRPLLRLAALEPAQPPRTHRVRCPLRALHQDPVPGPGQSKALRIPLAARHTALRLPRLRPTVGNLRNPQLPPAVQRTSLRTRAARLTSRRSRARPSSLVGGNSARNTSLGDAAAASFGDPDLTTSQLAVGHAVKAQEGSPRVEGSQPPTPTAPLFSA